MIITTVANEPMISTHDRMPLMIDKKDVTAWLYETDVAREMLGMEMSL